MKREQGILIGTVIAAIIMMFLCSVFTFSDAVSEKALTTCRPESVSITEDGKHNMILIYNHMDRLQIEISPCYKEVEDQKQEFYIGGGNDIYI